MLVHFGCRPLVYSNARGISRMSTLIHGLDGGERTENRVGLGVALSERRFGGAHRGNDDKDDDDADRAYTLVVLAVHFYDDYRRNAEREPPAAWSSSQHR